jgi:hypothetical protein
VQDRRKVYEYALVYIASRFTAIRFRLWQLRWTDSERKLAMSDNAVNLKDILDALTPEEREVVEANMRAKGTAPSPSCKVSEKGCVSLYGLRRMGIHFYSNEWVRILNEAERIKQFIRDNVDTLTFRSDEEREAVLEALDS